MMSTAIEQAVLCSQLCSTVLVNRRTSGQVMLDTPFRFPDGDHYPIYVTDTDTGGFRLSDGGHTLMHLSYENDVDKFLVGARRILLDRIVAQEGAMFDETTGAFFVESSADKIADAIFRLGQAVTRIFALTVLNRVQVASTFYEDLHESLLNEVPAESIRRDWTMPELDDGDNYPVDFRIETVGAPLFVYGIPNRDKARLTTIFLQHFIQLGVEFESLLVFANQEEMPRADLARLSNVGGEMVSSLNADADLRRKLKRRLRSV